MRQNQGYEKAEERIEQARQQQSKELDLNNLSLTEVPESLNSLTQLQKLDISRNNLKSLPEPIFYLQGLKNRN
uniref:Leucine-rich repeat protein n=1 Tax=Cyanothece sp. (strain PCC 7425 / ATCC 29141) TaxID=395961 RepID=B8HU77_CYAP4